MTVRPRAYPTEWWYIGIVYSKLIHTGIPRADAFSSHVVKDASSTCFFTGIPKH